MNYYFKSLGHLISFCCIVMCVYGELQLLHSFQPIHTVAISNIYISRKIRLCIVDLEGQFQTALQILHFHFPSIFCRSCQIHCFLHTVDAIHKRLIHLSHIFALNGNSRVCKKQWIWQLLQKIEGK